MSADKKSFQERMKRADKVCRLNMRAFRLMWKESASCVAVECVQNILWFCMPYWGIWFSARLLDEIQGPRNAAALAGYTTAMLLGTLAMNLLGNVLNSVAAQKNYAFNQSQHMIFARKIQEMDYDRLEEERTHMLFQRVERETFNDGKNLQEMRFLLPCIAGCLGGMVMSVAMVWEFLVSMKEFRVWIFVVFLLMAGGIWVSAKCQGAREKLSQACSREISANCLQRDGYLRYFSQYSRGKEIRIYGLGKVMIQKLLQTHHFNDRAVDKRFVKGIPYRVAGDSTEALSLTLTRCLAGGAALMGKISLGSMTQYTQSITEFVKNIRYFWGAMVALWYNADYLERYFEFLDLESHMSSGCLPVEKRMDGDYKIAFNHVSFRYPGSERYALEDICMEFQVGEKLAVMGMNGSGKSTFIKLLCRLYDPTEGVITMNGIDIRRYNYQEYLELFSVVFQDFKLFSFGLGENVALSEVYSQEKVREALERSGLEEFLEGLEAGLSTTLYRDFDRSGLEVSGGEAQRIALARAVCKGAPFVLLDEPTVALDPLAEYEIYEKFNELVADRTTVYISHRMSSCRFCGDIAVFHKGHMVQRGSHDTLMQEPEGKYYELWTAQAQYYQKEECAG